MELEEGEHEPAAPLEEEQPAAPRPGPPQQSEAEPLAVQPAAQPSVPASPVAPAAEQGTDEQAGERGNQLARGNSRLFYPCFEHHVQLGLQCI